MTWHKKEFIQKIPRFIRNNFVRKIVAFVLALILTMIVDIVQTTEDTYTIDDVPVHFILAPDLTYKTDIPPQYTTKITVFGKRTYWHELTKNDLEIKKEIPTAMKRFDRIKLDIKDIKVKKKYFFETQKIKGFSPEIFNLDLDRIVSKTVPVDPVYDEKELGKNFGIKGITCIPAEVTISGPSLLIREISKIKTEKIPLGNGINKDFTTDIKLVVPCMEATLSADAITCSVEIFEHNQADIVYVSEIKDLRDIPIQILSTSTGTPALRYSLTPGMVRVIFEGPSENIKKVKLQDIHPYVLGDNLKEGKTVCNVRLLTDMDKEKLKIISIIPDRVTVTAEKFDPESKHIGKEEK